MELACLNAIKACSEFGWLEEKAKVTLVTPQGFKRPPKFPRGFLLQVKPDGARIWHFSASRVLTWLRSNELVGS